MYGCDILCGISKGTFEIPYTISYPYIERFDFYKKDGILRALRFKSPEVFLKRPQAHAGDEQAATSFMTACTYIWAPFQYKDRLSRGGDFHDRHKRSWDCLIFIMGIPILARQRFYIDSPHCSTCWSCCAYKFPCSFKTQLKEKQSKVWLRPNQEVVPYDVMMWLIIHANVKDDPSEQKDQLARSHNFVLVAKVVRTV